MKFDYLIVGAGLYGATFAYEAGKRGKECIVIDKRGKKLVNSQDQFCQEAWDRIPKSPDPIESRRFIPAEPPVYDEEEGETDEV